MSLVGPRPALPEEVARYGSLYSARLLVKPGITGPWQVSGRSDLSQVATALFLAMASLVWIQPHLLLDGKQLFVIRIFFAVYMMDLFLWGIL